MADRRAVQAFRTAGAAKLTLWNPGFPEWESKIMLAPRTMSVVTGHPGHGKTQLWTQIWFNIVRAYCIPIAIASFETRAKPHIQRYLRTLLTGKLEKDMDDQEKRRRTRSSRTATCSWCIPRAAVAEVVSGHGRGRGCPARRPDHPG
jgi:hypothetical protein